MSTALPKVLVFGGTGVTGQSIVNGLCDSKPFNVVVQTRPCSINKPNVGDLRARGVTVIPLDIESASHDELKTIMKEMDTVISTLAYNQLQLQRKLVDAAREVGINRFIPCDFGTTGTRGWRELYDEKLGIRDYVKASGIGYTFIDVGFWYQIILPMISTKQAPYEFVFKLSHYFFEDGATKNACTDIGDIGQFVARIVADPRTLNKYVFVWGEELSQKEIFGYAREFGDPTLEPIHVSRKELEEQIHQAKSASLSGQVEPVLLTLLQYYYNMWILGENTVDNAKKEECGGGLDARALYPDLKVKTLREVAPAVYAPFKMQ